jgi:hypothetical protein
MRYEELKAYTGPKTACEHCKRAFKPGQVITTTDKELAFCYTDGDGGCGLLHMFTSGDPEMMFGEPCVYRPEPRPEPVHLPRWWQFWKQ